eukprot:1159033-Pelagomonas_calceolata.AAC.6
MDAQEEERPSSSPKQPADPVTAGLPMHRLALAVQCSGTAHRGFSSMLRASGKAASADAAEC